MLILAAFFQPTQSQAASGDIITVAGTGVAGFSGDGAAAIAAQLQYPEGIALDSAGNLYIADAQNNRIRKVDGVSGAITTIAGTVFGYSGDGGLATLALLNFPTGIAIDGSGNLYIADSGNNRIRKIDSLTGKISTVAGTGVAGFTGDGALATSAQLNGAIDVALDSAGNLYISDWNNQRIRKVDALTGKISTVAGSGIPSLFGDGGPATAAWLNYPNGIAIDGAGNLYIADTRNGRIRKVDAVSGNISTVAGTSRFGYSGDGGPATSAWLDHPTGVAVDGSGNLYIADNLNNRLRKVDALTGNISTVAGTGVLGYSGDGGPATSAQLSQPFRVVIDNSGNFYIADYSNHSIRKVSATTVPPNQPPVPTAPAISTAYATAGTSQVTANDPNAGDTHSYAVTTVAVHGAATINTGGLTTYTPNAGFSGADSFVVTVTDAAGATGTVTISVTVAAFIDTVSPVVTPPANITIEATSASGTPATNAMIASFLNGASATDNVAVVGLITNNAPVTLPVGVTAITFTARDAASNAGTANASITVNAYVPPGTPRPVITLILDTRIHVVGNAYVDAGATAFDSVDGNITGSIRVNNSVNTSRTGTYTVTYDVSNAAGTAALQVIRTVNVVASIIRIAGGVSGSGYPGDGGAATSANLRNPSDVAVDAGGNIYIAERNNHRIRKIDAATNTINTIAGTGTPGTSGDGGPAILAQIYLPNSVVLDHAGNLFTNSGQNVRKIDATTGIITTVASVLSPWNIAIDNAGNLYITESYSHRIQKVSVSTGRISTIAGNGVAGFSGDGGPATAAQLNFPSAVALDHAGNLYIADTRNNRIRKIDVLTGNISTVAGIGVNSYSGDGGAATAAALTGPEDIAFDSLGNLYVADTGNRRIRKIDAVTGNISTYAGASHAGGSGAATSVVLFSPISIAFDSFDNLYILDGSTFVTSMIWKASVTPRSVNQPPAPTAPAISTAYATAGTSQVAANDPNAGDTHTYAVTTAAVHGAATINTRGLATYTPNAGFSGADSFVVTVTDSSGATGTVTTSVTVAAFIDTVSPVVTPPANITIAAASVSGTSATSAVITAFLNGASATDNVAVAGFITNNAPATLPVGVTTIMFTARDAAGNTGTANATITVNAYVVPDTTRPFITLVGNASVRVVQGQTYVDAGARAFDNVDGNITGSITVHNPVNTSVIGAYTVTYNVSDAAGNTALQVTRTVNVIANTPPVISLTGATPLTIVQGTLYNDRGATAFDDIDGNVTARILTANTVNAAVVGVYTITYNVSDAAGHAATQVTRTIHVIPAGGAANRGEAIQLPLSGSVSVDISSAGEVISNFSAVTTSGTPPAGVSTPFGALSYTTTVATGSSTQTVNLAFSSALPTGFQLYKVDNIGAYTLIPEGLGTDHWIQLDALTIALTLTDGGRFDLDGGLVDGRIIDPVVVAIPPATAASPASGSGGCVIIPSAIFDPVLLLLVILSLVTLARSRRK